jgi:integrase/recombinase XerD
MGYEYAEEYLASNGSWAGETRDRYRRAINLYICELGDRKDLKASELGQWLDSHPWGSSMKWITLNAVKGFIRYRWGNKHPALKLKIRRKDSGPQRTLNAEQVKKLLSHFDTTTIKGKRDLAMACLMLDTGLRCSEITNIELKYVDLDNKALMVIIKGGKWGKAVFSAYTTRELIEWIIVRTGEKWLFTSIGGNTPGKKLTRSGLQRIIKYWGIESEIGELSPHDFRRTFATLTIKAGAPSRIVQVAGRWSSIELVERYTRVLEAESIEPYSPVMKAMGL